MRHRNWLVMALVPGMLIAGCSNADSASPRPSAPSPTEAAASGIAETATSTLSGSAIPREGVPDYVETFQGGRYLTGTKLSNDRRSGGMLMYAASGSVAEVVAFHRASMERHGTVPGDATVRPVRDHEETQFEGTSADGKHQLRVVVIDKSEPDLIVQLHYTDTLN